MNCVVCGTKMNEQQTALICPLCVKGNRLDCVQRKQANDAILRAKAEAFDALEELVLGSTDVVGQGVHIYVGNDGSIEIWKPTGRWSSWAKQLSTGPDLLSAVRGLEVEK